MTYSILKNESECKLSLVQIVFSFCMVFIWFFDNFCRKHCLLTSLIMCCSFHLHGKQFPSIPKQKPYLFHCTFPFQNLSSHYIVGFRLLYLTPVRNTVKILNFWCSYLHVYCCSLSQIVSTWLKCFAYIESIFDASIDIEQTEKNVLKVQTITSAILRNLHPFVLWTFVQKTLPDVLTLNVLLIFKERGFQLILPKLLPNEYFSFRIFNPIKLSDVRLFNLAPVRNM